MSAGDARGGSGTQRLAWLDGVRACAALFVVLHHVWLAAFPGFPDDHGPWWLSWALYGHLAVAVFIVVSGFSLALAPVRDGGRLRHGALGFYARRAWRILPPYWAALALSCLVVVTVNGPRSGVHLDGSSVLVYGLLVQDLVAAPVPNGVFWSIAVEWQIYFLFPAVLLIGRKFGLRAAAGVSVVSVLVAHLVAAEVPALERLNHLTPQLFALFCLGVLAASATTGPLAPAQRGRLAAVASGTGLLLVVAAATLGSRTLVQAYFWVDLGVGCGVAACLAVLAAGGFPRLRGVLARRPLVRAGAMSYSIYLVHAPVLEACWLVVVRPLGLTPLQSWLLLLLTVPGVLACCALFFWLFERPFVGRRTWRSTWSGTTAALRSTTAALPRQRAQGEVVPRTHAER